MKNTEQNKAICQKNAIQPILNRNETLTVSSGIIQQLASRLTTERFRARDSDPARLAYVRALASIMQIHASLLRDRDLDDLKDRISKLEASQK